MWKREQFANKGGDGALEVAIVRKESRMRISLNSYVVIGVISVIIRIVKAGRMSEGHSQNMGGIPQKKR